MRGLFVVLFAFCFWGVQASADPHPPSNGANQPPLNNNTHTPTPSPHSTTPTPTPSTVAGVPCIDSNGNIANVPSGNACKAILPLCSDLQTSWSKLVRTQLATKIWSYYQGNDLDLSNGTTTPLRNQICSVVGHKMAFQGDQNDFELTTQTIANKNSCGDDPYFKGDKDNKKQTINFVNQNGVNYGSKWSSWLLGAYPWIMRRNASDVLTNLSTSQSNVNLSNLLNLNNLPSSVTSNLSTQSGQNDYLVALQSATSAYSAALQGMSDTYAGLSAAAKEVCATPASTPTPGGTPVPSVIQKCMTGGYTVSDPAARICTLVKTQDALNTGSVPNMLIFNVMVRAQSQYDSLFLNAMAQTDPDFNQFISDCQQDFHVAWGAVEEIQKKHLYSCMTSCLIGGAKVYTYQDWSSATANGCAGRPRRCCELVKAVNLSDGSLVGNSGSSTVSVNTGMAGFIEYTLRKKVCQQTTNSDSNVCDAINIPENPKNVQ